MHDFNDKFPANQLWYEDPINGVIKSHLNDFALDSSGNSTSAANTLKSFHLGEYVVMMPYDGNENQQWERHGHKIENKVI